MPTSLHYQALANILQVIYVIITFSSINVYNGDYNSTEMIGLNPSKPTLSLDLVGHPIC